MLAMGSSDGGATFTERSVVCGGANNTIFGRVHTCPDGSAVSDGHGGVHVVFDWSTGLGARGPDPDNGLGYMHCTHPLGPCTVSPTPVNSMHQNGALPYKYRTTYGGTLLQRDADWLVLTAISTAGNAGGVWGLAALTAPNASGPYTTPTLLLHPESARWHPHPCEFYPCFAHDGYAYCPCTSVQRNRGYQVLFRAQLADATTPAAWEVHQAGSLYHWGGEASRATGIWGQTFNGFVDSAGGFRIMYPARNEQGLGTLNLAYCPSFPNLTTRGFWVSAPADESVAVFPATRTDFTVAATVVNPLGLPWSLRWNWRGELGPDGAGSAGLAASPRALANNTALCFDGGGRMSLVQLGALGTPPRYIVSGAVVPTGAALDVTVAQTATGAVAVAINGTHVLNATLDSADIGGALAVHATRGNTIHVVALTVDVRARPPQRWLSLNAADGISGGGSAGIGGWTPVTAPEFRTGVGMSSPGGPSTMAKWSFVGTAVRLWLPRGPSYGAVTVAVDTNPSTVLNLWASTVTASSVLFSWVEPAGPPPSHHRHAIVVRWLNGTVIADSVDFLPNILPGF